MNAYEPRSCILAPLTPAELLVARQLRLGLSNKEIASLLNKAEPTIKHQVSSILDKTKAESRCRFIALYYEQLFNLASSPASIGRSAEGTSTGAAQLVA